ncbi:MAG: ABC transporter permease [Alphaproteobacteria bacterium]|nr:ABC transporter permease [Alphaproteobacteria bacterium]
MNKDISDLFNYQEKDGVLTLYLSGSFEFFDEYKEKTDFFLFVQKTTAKKIVFKGEGLISWDSAFSSYLYKVIKFSQEKGLIVSYEKLPTSLKSLLDLALAVDRKPEKTQAVKRGILEDIGEKTISFYQIFAKGMAFCGMICRSFGNFFRGRAVVRGVDFVSALDECGPKALLIVSLISFMVGVILAFVGSIQLKTFGAQIYVASLVTIGMIRIMGAIMVGVIMAGRTGASYAATIGTMQVNEELDALKTMGIPSVDFLVLPRIFSLLISMPILVMIADFMGMAGGAFVGTFLLEISPEEYWKYAWSAFGLTNFLVGIFHGIVFGIIISICGCYYGVYCGRNADSVGKATTKAVVSSIVWMIVLTGVITWMCEVLNI